MPPDTAARGLTVLDVAARYRVSPDKVRSWIRRGELKALNVAASLCGKPQLRVTQENLLEFERLRSAAVPTPEAPRRRRRRVTRVDYFPDL
jgi:hypothetical protein